VWNTLRHTGLDDCRLAVAMRLVRVRAIIRKRLAKRLPNMSPSEYSNNPKTPVSLSASSGRAVDYRAAGSGCEAAAIVKPWHVYKIAAAWESSVAATRRRALR